MFFCNSAAMVKKYQDKMSATEILICAVFGLDLDERMAEVSGRGNNVAVALSVTRVIEELTFVERIVLKMRFGMYPYSDSHTLAEVGASIGRTGGRARQIEVRALRRLKHPTKAGRIKRAMEASGSWQKTHFQ